MLPKKDTPAALGHIPASVAPLPPNPVRVIFRDAVIVGIAGPAIEFVFGFLFFAMTGEMIATYHVLPVYGHTSLLSPLVWGPAGALLLFFYRRFMI